MGFVIFGTRQRWQQSHVTPKKSSDNVANRGAAPPLSRWRSVSGAKKGTKTRKSIHFNGEATELFLATVTTRGGVGGRAWRHVEGGGAEQVC